MANKLTGPIKLRRDDLLNLKIEFVNIGLTLGQPNLPSNLWRFDSNAKSFIVITFPPQHYVLDAPHNATMWAANPSRIVLEASDAFYQKGLNFQTGEDGDPVPDSILDGLVGWSVVPSTTDGAFTTAIEFPYNLLLIPAGGDATAFPAVRRSPGSSDVQKLSAGYLALVNRLFSYAVPIELRAVSERSTTATIDDKYQENTLTRGDRNAIIDLSRTIPIKAQPLLLGALGATTNLSLKRPQPRTLTEDDELDSYVQNAVVGLDNYLEVAYRIYPWAAKQWMSLVKIWQRDIDPATGAAVFGLAGHKLRLCEQDALFSGKTLNAPTDAWALGFCRVRLDTGTGTRETPFLDVIDDPNAPQNIAGYHPKRAVLTNAGAQTSFLWKAKWLDWADQEVASGDLEFLYFEEADFDNIISGGDQAAAQINAYYHDSFLNRVSFSGAELTIVDKRGYHSADGDGPDVDQNIALNINTLALLGIPESDPTGRHVRPRAGPIDLALPAVAQLAGGDASGAITIAFTDAYCSSGLQAEKFYIFAEADVAAQQARGLVSKDARNALVAASATLPQLSAKLGVLTAKLNGISSVGNGDVKFSDLDLNSALFDSKILNLITLRQLLATAAPELMNPKVPPQFTHTLAGSAQMTQSFVIKGSSQDELVWIEAGTVTISAELSATAAGVHRHVSYSMPPLHLNLPTAGAGCFVLLKLGHSSVDVTYDSNDGLHVDAPIADVQFPDGSLLNAINSIRSGLPSESLVEIRQTVDLISANLKFHLPNINLGAFAIRDLKFRVGIDLPTFDFSKGPEVRLAIAEKLDQFSLSMGPYTGYGFFQLDVTKIQMVAPPFCCLEFEGSLDFGASLALDLGIASGAVSAHAGFYFKCGCSEFDLDAHLMVSGSLNVLGLIDINAFFYLAIGYYAPKYVGEAWLHVDISMFFFDLSVDIKCRREFAPGSQRVRALMAGADENPYISRAAWNAYCDAFV